MDAPTQAAMAAEIRQLIDGGQSKPALRRAKDHYRSSRTLESESLLVDAYLARVESLIQSGLPEEARSLLDLVCDQFPTSRVRHQSRISRLSAALGDPSELVASLINPALAPENRRQIEQAIRREVTDLEWLADSSVLPTGHPLRCCAAALCEAFNAVTSGPVSDEQITLAQVPRKHPLAPWKPLIRAIALFYRRDWMGCERCLDLIHPDSAPARLIPAMRHLLNKPHTGARLAPTDGVLCGMIKAPQRLLHDALRELDRAFEDDDLRCLDRSIRTAVKMCQKYRPDVLEKLRQHISIRGVLEEVPKKRLQKAMGKPSRKNAYFWRLFARAAEVSGDPFQTCSLWEQFRRHAIHENWFEEDGPEVAAMFVHMAEQLRQVPQDVFWSAKESFARGFKGYASYYKHQPSEIRDLEPKWEQRSSMYFLSPAELYRRAGQLIPESEVFAKWLDWAQQFDGKSKRADEAAEAWHKAIRSDTRPLLHLMTSAERRNALKKAMGYLEKSEALDAVNPQIRQARLRLCVAITTRHLKEGKRHLVERDLTQLEELPQIQHADRAGVVWALRAVKRIVNNDSPGASAARTQVIDQVGDDSAADLLISAIADACGTAKQASPLTTTIQSSAQSPTGRRMQNLVRACVLAEDMGIGVDIPGAWQQPLIKELNGSSGQLDSLQLLQLALTARHQRFDELAYAAAGSGLRQADAGPQRGYLLLVRAKSMPSSVQDRKEDCLSAATHLARQHRDDRLIQEVTAYARDAMAPWNFEEGDWHDPMDNDQLRQILEREQKTKRFPSPSTQWYEPFVFKPRKHRAKSGRAENPPEDEPCFFDMDRTEDETEATPERSVFPDFDFEPNMMPDELLEEMDGEIPPNVISPLVEMLFKHMKANGDLPHPKQLARIDPDLTERLMDAIEEAERHGELPFPHQPFKR